MKFTFKNLGPIKEADLKLGDLTIIAGRNNTGKTYIAYALYGFLNGFDRMFSSKWGNSYVKDHFTRIGSGSIEEATQRLRDEGEAFWDISAELLSKERERLVVEMAKEYSRNWISKTFNASREQFEGASLGVSQAEEFLGLSSRRAYFGRHELGIAHDCDRETIVVSLSDPSMKETREISFSSLRRFFVRTYIGFLLGGYFMFVRKPYIFSSSRHSIPLFIEELDYVRNQVVLSMQHLEHESNVRPTFDYGPLQNTSSYPLPVHDNIDFFRGIPRLAESQANDIAGDSVGPIEEMLGGRFDVQDGSLRFKSISDEGADFDIPLYLASSSSWELSSLHFFNKYFDDVFSSHLIIIDEPESHLDTTNQIKLARLLAQLVNFDNQVLITTHSDYIVKEVNNLIMLSCAFARKDETMKRLGYRDADILSPDQVRAYTAEDGGLTPNKVDEFGIQMGVFDQTIDDINRTSRELFVRIQKEKEEN